MSELNPEDIDNKLKDLDDRLSRIEELLVQGSKSLPKKISIKEFILSLNIKDDIQITLALAYFLERYSDFTSISSKDILNACREAKVNIPVDNIGYKLYKNVAKGYLMEVKEKKVGQKAYTLTITGEQVVENNYLKEKINVK